MLTIMLLAIGLPVLAGTAYVVLRNSRPQLLADMRGIALQTVIVIVVLLAIAGAVAGVLVTRGGQAVTELEGQEITRNPADIGNRPDCVASGFTWNDQGTTATNDDVCEP